MAAGNSAIPPAALQPGCLAEHASSRCCICSWYLLTNRMCRRAILTLSRKWMKCIKARTTSRIYFNKDQRASFGIHFSRTTVKASMGPFTLLRLPPHCFKSIQKRLPSIAVLMLSCFFFRNGGCGSRIWKLLGFFIFQNLWDPLKISNFANPENVAQEILCASELHSFCLATAFLVFIFYFYFFATSTNNAHDGN